MRIKAVSITLGFLLSIHFANVALAQEVVLRLAHFWPTRALLHREAFQPWADAVAKGDVDLGITVLGYTPGRFPLTQIIELPSLVNSGEGGSCTLQTIYNAGYLDEELGDTHPIFLFTHGPGHIHTKNTSIKTPRDLARLNIRRPSMIAEAILKEIGAEPVSMAAPQIYEAAEKNNIQGATLPWSPMFSWKLNDQFSHHTEIGIYTITFILTMNKEKYQSLPPRLQQIIDRNSGMAWAKIAGQIFDKADRLGRQAAIERKHTITTIAGADPKWGIPMSKVAQNYIWKLALADQPSAEIYNRIVNVAATSCATEI